MKIFRFPDEIEKAIKYLEREGKLIRLKQWQRREGCENQNESDCSLG